MGQVSASTPPSRKSLDGPLCLLLGPACELAHGDQPHPAEPEQAEVGLDVRDVKESRVDEILDGIVAFARGRAEERGQQITYREHLRTAPVDMAREVVADLEDYCELVGISCRRMVSGAGHDAMMIARRVPAGMLFVPSRGGISHSPEEFTEPRHLAQAVAVLLGAVGGGVAAEDISCR